MAKRQKRFFSFEDRLANNEDETLRSCDHDESWQEPHTCPVFEFLGEVSKCVCCEDCEYECFLDTPGV